MPGPGCVQFAEFTFDPASGELRRGAERLPLEHQPSLVLGRLVAEAGRVVSRDDLAVLLWGTATHVKFDDGLNYCIRQLRAALDDDAKSPRFIETLPRRGYRFTAPVTTADSAGTRAWSLPRLAMAMAMAFACVLVAFAETQPNNHHQVAVSIARSLHDLIF